MSIESFFKELQWRRLRFSLKNQRNVSNYPFLITVNSIVKEVSSKIYQNFNDEPTIFFHLPDRFFNFSPKKDNVIPVEVFFVGEAYDVAHRWKEELLTYFKDEENSRNNSLDSVGEVEERDYEMLEKNVDFSQLDEEITLLFYTPLHYTTKKGKERYYIDDQILLKLYLNRFERLFKREFPKIDTKNILVIPYYWSYTQIKKPSLSQGGNLIYINGCFGKLYLRGEYQKIVPYLILGSELHCGGKISYGYGYYKFFPKSLGFYDANLVNINYIEAVYNQVLDESDDPDIVTEIDDTLPKRIAEEIINENYKPLPVKTFVIPKSDGGSRTIEKFSLKDTVVHKMIYKMFYKTLDKAMEYESIGYRKGLGRDEAVKRINDAIAKGYIYVIESDVEDFFPSIDHEILLKTLDLYIPKSDRKFRELLKKVIKTKYYEGGVETVRSVGISLGSPLSPLFANIYLDFFDEEIKENDVVLVRYADDFVILTKTFEDAENVLTLTHVALNKIKLKINKDKTSIKHIKEGFTFLGYTFTGDGHVVESTITPNPYRKPLYVTEPYTFLGRSADRIEVKKGKELLASVPIKRLSEVILLEKSSMSTQFIKACIDNNIPISLTLNSGYYVTTIKPDSRSFFDTISLHGHKYYKMTEAEKLSYAMEFVLAKIENQITSYKKRRYENNQFYFKLNDILNKIKKSTTLDELRGLEGVAAKIVFSALNEVINVEEFKSLKRGRTEPDRLNALLNYGYYLLFSKINSLIRASSLNPYLGFLHSDINNYESLAADVQEPFRTFVDRLVVRLINLSAIKPDDFVENNGRYFLKPEARKTFLISYEAEFTNTEIFDGYTINDMIFVQVKNIKRWVDQDIAISVVRWK